jgi:post-segregation antitoxin (ccd killing protein)
MQVYLPDDLYRKVKAKRGLNVSAILRRALEEELAELSRRDAGRKAVRAYEAEHGAFTEAEIAAVVASDAARAIRPLARKRKRRAA